jgi:hypothetical protein
MVEVTNSDRQSSLARFGINYNHSFIVQAPGGAMFAKLLAIITIWVGVRYCKRDENFLSQLLEQRHPRLNIIVRSPLV